MGRNRLHLLLPVTAFRIASQMLLSESRAVDEEVLDAVAKISNMIIGNVKTALEGQLGPLGLSPPTVTLRAELHHHEPGQQPLDRDPIPV